MGQEARVQGCCTPHQLGEKMTRQIFQILSAFRWLMLVLCLGLAVALRGVDVVFLLMMITFAVVDYLANKSPH